MHNILENDLLYVNFLPLADQMNIDYSKDTYDGGLHMNLGGARSLRHVKENPKGKL